MKNFKLTFLAFVAVALVFAGCKKEDAITTPTLPEGAASFYGSVKTTVNQGGSTIWAANDAIGIYMVTANGTVAANTLAENKKYTTSMNGETGWFSPASSAETIFFPPNGSPVDFVSYYPYVAGLSNYTYAVNVTDQSSQAAIDLLYSANVKGITKNDPTANMVFEHKLSKLVLNITNLTEVTLADMVITVSGMNTLGTFDLSAGALSVNDSKANFNMKVTAGTASAVAEAIVLPSSGAFSYELTFNIPTDGTQKTIVVSGANFEAGKKYVYNVEITENIALKGKGTIVDWDEVPAGDLVVDKNAFPLNIPFVYSVENTAQYFTRPPLPGVDELPVINGLPDPFAWADGSGRITKFSDWKYRRSEIITQLGYYELGEKPVRPSDITATMDGTTLRIVIKENGATMDMWTVVNIPAGDGPFPVIIGANSMPAAATFPGCVRVQFSCNQVALYSMFGGRNRTYPFWQMYPDLTDAGDYCAWSWGISRIIDGLELVAGELPIDLKHIGLIGCSYAGKLALFGGAMDERIALTLVQESGGGGINSWRVSDTMPAEIGEEVERINNTSYTWFMQALKTNFMGQSNKLPYDHHEAIALIAPRAVLIYGNPDYVWMADKSGYISTMAAYEVWKSMGIEDRFGYDFSDSHTHCVMSSTQSAATTLFVNKFLKGIDGPTETVRKAPAQKFVDKWAGSINYYPWIDAWYGHTLR